VVLHAHLALEHSVPDMLCPPTAAQVSGRRHDAACRGYWRPSGNGDRAIQCVATLLRVQQLMPFLRRKA
jgi:hypothetical protein